MEAVQKFLQSRGLEAYILSRNEIDKQTVSRPGSTLLVIDDSFYTPSALDKDDSYTLSVPHFRTRLSKKSFNKTQIAAFNYGEIVPMPFDILSVTPKPGKSLAIETSNPAPSFEELYSSFDLSSPLINYSFFNQSESPDRNSEPANAVVQETIKIITDQPAAMMRPV